MPFSRIRVLKRLRKGAMTVSELARAAAMDAPAATVTVNDLEERGLVVREVDPTNRRSKLVSITDAGRAALADALGTPDPAPKSLVDLPADELSALHEILRKLEH
ncbi:MarR family transcriptional regulator [Nocardia terpenica]